MLFTHTNDEPICYFYNLFNSLETFIDFWAEHVV